MSIGGLDMSPNAGMETYSALEDLDRLRRAEGRRPRGCERSIVCGRGIAIDGVPHTEPLERERKERKRRRGEEEEETWLSP